MPFIELTEKEILHIENLDSQHQNYVNIVSELYSFLGKDKPETIKFLFNQLEKELKFHFETEENFMKNNNYVNYYSHKLEHERYYNKIVEISKNIKEGKEKLNLEMLKTFKNWMVNHIALNDKKLADFLLENKIEQYK